MGDKWYLIFSCFNNWWETRYRYADSLEGPWTEPANDDMFDGRQFYAAKQYQMVRIDIWSAGSR